MCLRRAMKKVFPPTCFHSCSPPQIKQRRIFIKVCAVPCVFNQVLNAIISKPVSPADVCRVLENRQNFYQGLHHGSSIRCSMMHLQMETHLPCWLSQSDGKSPIFPAYKEWKSPKFPADDEWKSEAITWHRCKQHWIHASEESCQTCSNVILDRCCAFRSSHWCSFCYWSSTSTSF